MTSLVAYLIRDCYATFLCISIIISFLIISKNYNYKIINFFTGLCILVLVENIASTIERYLGNQPVYSSWRLVLSWICYLTGPAIILTIIELVLRDSKKSIKWILTIPQFINILITSTCFFGDWCFRINPQDNHFIPGTLCIIPRITPIVYLVFLIIISFLKVGQSKIECIIVLVGSAFVLFDYFNEITNFSPISVREITIAITVVAYFMYFTAIHHIDKVQELNNSFAESEERYTKEMVDQSIETLSFTIDAKDQYTRGHSSRVAKYSRMIAQLYGKSEVECNQIYRAALLHDIGKISISGSIINKNGKLTEAEYDKIKTHSANGARILEKMKSIPYLQNGAKYHHERYDGKGYPCGLKGEEIPELARIISVADAYDAMTSYRSYRQPMDQEYVKQEIWKGMGTQFDPKFAKIMISLMDADRNYEMHENPEIYDEITLDRKEYNIEWKKKTKAEEPVFDSFAAFIQPKDYWIKPSQSIYIPNSNQNITFKAIGRPAADFVWCSPTIIIYSSDNGELLAEHYDELAVIVSTGYSWREGISLAESSFFTRKDSFISWENWIKKNKLGIDYTIHSIIDNNILTIKIENDYFIMESNITLPANYKRDIYMFIAGERCDISEISCVN